MLIDGRPIILATGRKVRPIEELLLLHDVLDRPDYLSSVNIVNVARARAIQLRDVAPDPTVAAEASALAEEFTDQHIHNIGAVSAYLRQPIAEED